MRMTIDTEVLQENNLTLGDFLVLLMGAHDIDYGKAVDSLVKAGIAQRNLFDKGSIVLSDNTKDLVARVLMESGSKGCNIDFDELARRLQEIYPQGVKPGTKWRGTTEEIAQKLRTLVVQHGFTFTAREAITATQEYVDSFEREVNDKGETGDRTHMMLLKYFLLRTYRSNGEIISLFMTIIENNR